MRAAIFASLIPAPGTDEERERLEHLIVTIRGLVQKRHNVWAYKPDPVEEKVMKRLASK